MSSMLGTALRVSIFGESHAPAIGCSIDGMPAGVPLDLDELQNFLDRRAPGRDATATTRREADRRAFYAASSTAIRPEPPLR